jgi:methenyltetrahydromethanopterin cyclohydrolase
VDGSLAAGLAMARTCLADLASVSLVHGDTGPAIQVTTDAPVAACLASQYAGWQIQLDGFFAMGSGPMRAIYAGEEIFQRIPGKENASCAVGVLETRRHPTEQVITHLVRKLPTTVDKITLLVAPASSIAGTIQVVARSVETALHKLHELKFDVTQVMSATGIAPLPPVAKDEKLAIGRTNNAILYGGRVTLWVKCDDELLETFGPKVPSNASPSHGRPFADLLSEAGGDFYKLDPLLFAPAEITFVNLKSGRAFRFGAVSPSILERSFFGA